MKKFRLCISLLLCLCLCLCLCPSPLAVCASAEGSEEAAGGNETPLSPVEQVFQVISLLILFGGIAMLPLYYLLNRRRKRIVASFEQTSEQKSEQKKEADETNT